MKASTMEKQKLLNEDLVWLCFVNYVKTYEQAGETPRVNESAASDGKPLAKA